MMLRRLRVTPVVMTVAASTALAQNPEGVPQPAAPTPAPSAAPAPAPPADNANGQLNAGGGTQGQLAPTGVYTVKSGDTLWDLSGQFLNNPWYWPKIWADNPGVENPHWIYPGNRLRIRQDGDGGAGQVSGEANPMADRSDAANPDMAPAPQALPDVSRGTLTADPTFTQGGEVDSVDITPYKMPGFLRVRVKTLITDRELQDTGTITNSFERKEMLSSMDRVYLTFNKIDDVKIGAMYSIFRPREPIIHPITKQPFGFQTDLLGTLKIVGKSGNLAVGEIGSVTGYVQRGDHLTLAVALEKTVQRIPNATTVRGYVLATDTPRQDTIGENHVVFIDKGSKDGVQDGNTFMVVQSGDGLDKFLLGNEKSKTKVTTLPLEAVATLLIFNVKEHSSSAMVMKSVREVNVGDVVEMHPATAEGAGGDAP